ncbi:MAG: N-acetyl-alpha-D-glucosaminyl L-malate synthase BshA [Vulcanimicrobiota bacterium]
MKIGITCYPGMGGSGILGTELGKHLARRGHEVHFITSSTPVRLGTSFRANIHFHEAEVLDYPVFKYPPYSLSLAAKMAEIAKQVPLDLLHVHYAIPHAASANIAKQMLNNKLKVITTLHGTDVTLVGSRPGFIPLTAFYIEQSDGVTAVSNHLRDVTNEIFKIRNPIEVIYNFVDTSEFKPVKDIELRRQFANDDEKILIHISNFRPVKKTLNTIRVFDGIRKKIPSRLLMIGDGVDYFAAHRLVEALGIEDKVKFLGKVESVHEILSVADLFIINSVKESFGLAVLEAAACGTPALVTRIGGLPEVVVDGKTGLLSPGDDVEDMIEKGIELLSNEKLLNEMSKNCRRRAVEEFEVTRIVPLYEQYYEKILSK